MAKESSMMTNMQHFSSLLEGKVLEMEVTRNMMVTLVELQTP